MQNSILPPKNTHWLARRTPFFYGYIILPIAIISSFLTSPGQTYMVSIFNPSFRETLDLSLTQLTGAYMFGTLLASSSLAYRRLLAPHRPERNGSSRSNTTAFVSSAAARASACACSRVEASITQTERQRSPRRCWR